MADRRRSVADSISAEAKAGFDPQWLYVLSHMYDVGGRLTYECPAADGVSPPTVIVYGGLQEERFAAPDGHAAIAGGGGGEDDEPVVIDPPAPLEAQAAPKK